MTSTLDACFQSPKAQPTTGECVADTSVVQTAPRIMQAFHAHGDACERAEAQALQLASNPASAGEADDADWEAPLRVHAEVLDTLEQLHTEALELEESILGLTSSSGLHDEHHPKPHPGPDPEFTSSASTQAQAHLLGIFKACLPVLRARIANLSMAQELVDGARENTSITLRMESLGLLD